MTAGEHLAALGRRPRRLVLDDRGFLDAPRWHDGLLWCSDMGRHQILAVDPGGTLQRVIDTPGRPGGLGWLPDGGLLVVLMDERMIVRWSPAGIREHADLRPVLRAAANDMVVDARGNAYVTGYGYDAATEAPRPTRIVRVDESGSVHVQPGDLLRPNGCVLNADETVLVVAETRVHRLSRFAVGGDGRLSGHEVWSVLPRGSWADGIAMDDRGGVWVADPKGRRCYYVDPAGTPHPVIDTSPYACVACEIGGPDGAELYLLLGDLAAMAGDGRAHVPARIESVSIGPENTL